MAGGFTIAQASSPADIRTAAALFDAYAASLPVGLDYQDFATELAGLPGKYCPPDGALLLARGEGGAALGCVALRPLENGAAEMKRLYLLPASRGLGLGRALADAVVEEARRLGYHEIRLDTLPTMTRAIEMYQAMGPESTVFMALKL
jgi:ribosomal protein S18 acetylase RimI-like enzyme